MSQPTVQPLTYTEHLSTAQTALESINEHPNPHIQATIAQAHALTAVALLLEELLGALDQHKEDQPYQTNRNQQERGRG